MPLTPPSQFPPTYGDADDASIDDGAPYSTTAWSALLDGALIKQGLQIAIVMDEAGGAVRYNLTGYVGCPSRFKMVSLPFYWYGANERTTEYVPLTAEVTGTMPQTHVDAFYARVPIANFTAVHHPARKFQHQDLIVGPRAGLGALRFATRAELDAAGHDGFANMATVLQLLSLLMTLDGESGMATQ